MRAVIGIKCLDSRLVPDRAHPTDAGADLRTIESLDVYPDDTHMFDTGVAVRIPVGYVGLVFNRSSQGKIHVSIPHSVGVIDSDYRGNIKVILWNQGTEIYKVKAYDTKIAQLVIMPVMLAGFQRWDPLNEDGWNDTSRGVGGFGSTGV